MEELVCQITGKVLDAQNALEYKINGLSKYVDPVAVLELVQNSTLMNVVLERIALNQTTFNEIISIRKQAQAKSSGIQEGANKAVDALRASIKDSGLDPAFFEELVQKTFNQTQKEINNTEETSTAE